MRVAMLGLGLIGGSVARALRARADAPVIAAWTPSGAGPGDALRDRVIDEAADRPEAALEGADLVILAAPASDCLALLDGLAGPWRPALADDAVITDVASTKRRIIERARTHRLRFVGGHPMAGRETSGYGASSAELLADRPWVVVPSGDAPADERVVAVATACRARPVLMHADEHDRIVAGISHLPLVVAAALVEAVAGGSGAERADWPLAQTLTAGGWRDMTRLARGDATMGAGILATNGDAVAERIRALVTVLEDWATALERAGDDDEARLADRLRAARDRLGAPDG
jgi:prephenate dehydrogenase